MSSNTLPYWHRLLRDFENLGYVQNGLTILFLLGALEIVGSTAELWTIDELVVSID